MDRRIFSLEEVARSIRRTIAERYGSTYWIKAEMNKLNHYPHSGHCFPELLEKKDGKVVAEMRGLLWNVDYQRINRQFLEIVREPLKDGVTILFQASIQYDPLYGLSLKIHDIDPSYALGELEREKQESILRLRKEGVFDANKRLPFPLVPKRVAVISVESSKGYSDFMQIIARNPYGYRLEITLFPALLQGDRSVASITAQLETVRRQQDAFDVVLIIRGGGGEVGLSSYNQYVLAAAIARFPLPVMTGIGHSTNETVSELVAYQSAVTPSELADFLIRRFHDFAEQVEHLGNSIQRSVIQALGRNQERLLHLQWNIRARAAALMQQQALRLGEAGRSLRQASQNRIRESKSTLDHLERQTGLMDPIHVLRRGFSITLNASGNVITDPAGLQPGERISTRLAGGSIESTVIESTITTTEQNHYGA